MIFLLSFLEQLDVQRHERRDRDVVTFGGKSGTHARDSKTKNKFSEKAHCNYFIESRFYVVGYEFKTGR